MTRLGCLVLLVGAGCTKLFGIQELPAPPAPPSPEAGGLVAASQFHSCAIHDDRTVWCWGRNIEDQVSGSTMASEVHTPVQVGTAQWNSVAARSVYTCGVQTDRSMWCWGSVPKAAAGTYDVDLAPMQLAPAPVAAVIPGVFHMCILSPDGELQCRGDNTGGELGDGTTTSRNTFAPVAEPGPWLTAATGYGHTCAIKLDGTLWCWGANNNKQLGIPDTSPVTAPRQVGTDTYKDIAAGYDYSCGLTSSGHLRCWGGNTFGQLGTGNTNASPLPTPVLVGGMDVDGWTQVRVSWQDHTCARRTDGSLWCWGHSAHGEAGVDGTFAQTTPNEVSGVWKDISVGLTHNCGIRDDGHVWCFGSDGFGELGDGGTSVTTPMALPGTWNQIAISSEHTCALDKSGNLSCAGINDDGELGVNTRDSHQGFVPVSGSWTAVDVGAATTCGIQGGHVYCWGINNHGQLGNNGSNEPLAPVETGTFTTASVIATRSQGCAIANGVISCWGTNANGQVGNNMTFDQDQPVPVGAGLEVDTGNLHTCARSATGGVACWGGGSSGALGQGSDSSDHLTPVGVPGLSNIIGLVVGWDDSCAIDGGSTAWCWGRNDGGQLGLGDQSGHPSPVALPNHWNQIALGRYHGCGIRTDQSLWCWGLNNRGQRGDPSAGASASNQVMPGHTWRSVVGGEVHTCAIDTNDVAWCWGANEDGQLANGNAWRAAPVQVQ